MTNTHHTTDPQTTHAGNGEDSAQGPGEPSPGAQPTEDELRAAYEAELNRISVFELCLQTMVSLLNIGGRRLGLAAGSEEVRDLEQVRDAIDGARALMPLLERRMPPGELRPLRDALAQLQMAYARQASAGAPATSAEQPAARAPDAGRAADSPAPTPSDSDGGAAPADGEHSPGPAESSGRLWVPGR